MQNTPYAKLSSKPLGAPLTDRDTVDPAAKIWQNAAPNYASEWAKIKVGLYALGSVAAVIVGWLLIFGVGDGADAVAAPDPHSSPIAYLEQADSGRLTAWSCVFQTALEIDAFGFLVVMIKFTPYGRLLRLEERLAFQH